jgi:hypothetical protein
MTLDEFDQRYPNGLVDAEITALTLDYRNRIAELRLNLRCNSPDSPNSGEYAQAVLTLQKFYYFSIESPEPDHLYPVRPKITVEELPEDPERFPLFEYVKPMLPAGAFSGRFYVHDWNSFIHVAAPTAAFSVATGDEVPLVP